MDTKILLLRTSYWAAAILDVLAFLMMLSPALFAWNNQLGDFHPGVQYRYAMGMGAPLMLGWTILLLWADRKPLDRRHILWITLLVILGEVLVEIYGVSAGFLLARALVRTWALQSILTALLLLSLWRSAR